MFRFLTSINLKCFYCFLFFSIIPNLVQAQINDDVIISIQLKAEHSQKCLEVANYSLEIEANAQQGECHGQAHQIWEVISHDNAYLLRARHSQLCLAVEHNQVNKGANVSQQLCTGQSHQLWHIFNQQNNALQIQNSMSQKCLDVAGWAIENGANVFQWDCVKGFQNQLFLPETLDGKLTADKNLIVVDESIGRANTTLNWRVDKPFELYVSVDKQTEKLVAASGQSVAIDWITAGHQFDFNLYEVTQSSKKLLDSTTILGIKPLPVTYPKQQHFGAGSGIQKYANLGVIDPISVSWDGRLFITAHWLGQEGDPFQKDYEYGISLFKPEAMQYVEEGRRVDPTQAFLPSVRVSNNNKTPHQLHVALFPEPGYRANPFSSDATGQYNADGHYSTYRLGIIGKSFIAGEPAADNEMNFLTMHHATVIVKNPNSTEAVIETAQMDEGDAQTLYDTNGNKLYGYEPTISLDGRLLIWSGRAHNLAVNNGTTMYSFNPTPNRTTGWSPAQPITSLYYRHGPGANQETLINGIPFSQHYPLAKKPFRSADGMVFTADDIIHGPYPWLSFDASELFFQAVRVFYGGARTASTVVGARTNWVMQHIDGAINPSRSNVSSNGRVDHFPDQAEYNELVKAYSSLKDIYDQPLGVQGFHRILLSGFALSDSMWEPINDDNFLWRQTEGNSIYSFFLSSSARYAEVPLNIVEDGHYVLYWPMNEQIHYDRQALQKAYSGNGVEPGKPIDWTGIDIWDQYQKAVRYMPENTPDISGNLNNGQLYPGAEFPVEFYQTQQKWTQWWNAKKAGKSDIGEPSMQGDMITGIKGNAIHFRQGGYVKGRLDNSRYIRSIQDGQFTAQLWFKPEKTATSFPLFNLGQGIVISFDNGAVQSTVKTKNETIQLQTVSSISERQWSHVLLTSDGEHIKLYINGQLEAEKFITELPLLSNNEVIVGPMQAGSAKQDEYLVRIDEVAISDITRDESFIRKAAFIRNKPEIKNKAASLIPASLSDLKIQLPVNSLYSNDIAILGKKLFFDSILSKDKSISCASCHNPKQGYSDGFKHAIGINNQIGKRNTPTIINRLFGTKQFVDGRSRSLEEQALMPIENPEEMGLAIYQAIERLRQDESYIEHFTKAFADVNNGQDIQANHLASALASFQRTLISANSRDDLNELSAFEKKGKELFNGKARCVSCHKGSNFTDEKFHNVGITINNDSDLGLENITRSSADRGKFRTPTLRDIELTAPYFHNGRFNDLDEVIEFYNQGGNNDNNRSLLILPLSLNKTEKDQLKAYLKTLTGTTVKRTTFDEEPAVGLND